MNELTTITAMPDATTFEDWMNMGRNLSAKRRDLNWLIGDWALHGQTHFPEQFALALQELSDAPKALKETARVAQAFPPALRDTSLSFAHHANVATLPQADALTLLKRAHTAKLSAKQIKVEASVRKIEIGQRTIWSDKDIDYAELMAIVRSWNSAQPSIREQFLEMANSAKLGLVEA